MFSIGDKVKVKSGNYADSLKPDRSYTVSKVYNQGVVQNDNTLISLKEKGCLTFWAMFFRYDNERLTADQKVGIPDEFVVRLQFSRLRPDYYPSKSYSYLCRFKNVEIGDYAIVEDALTDHKYAMGKIVDIQYESKRASKEIVTLVDVSDYEMKKAKIAALNKLEGQLRLAKRKAEEHAKAAIVEKQYEELLMQTDVGKQYLAEIKDLETKIKSMQEA